MARRKKPVRSAEHQNPKDDQNVTGIFGVPQLFVPENVNPLDLGESLLGVKSNIALRGMKEASGRIFRAATQRVNWILGPVQPGDLSKEEMSAATLTAAFLGNDLRRELMRTHWEMTVKGEHEARLEKVPVLEYELLARWRQDCSALKKGKIPNICLESPLPGGLDRVLLTNAFSPYSDAGRTANQFSPDYLMPLAEQLIMDLSGWDDKDESEKVAMAGAAYALSSAFASRRFLGLILAIVPEMGEHLSGVLNVAGVVGAPENVTDILEFIYTDSEYFMVSEVTELYCLIRKFSSSNFDSSLIEPIRSVIDRFEVRSKEVATLNLQDVLNDLGCLSDDFEELESMVSVAGRPFPLEKGKNLVKSWEDLFSHPAVKDSEKVRALIVPQAMDFFNNHADRLNDLIENFEEISEQKAAIQSGETSWEDQFKRLSKVKEGLDAFELNCSELIDDLSAVQLPDIENILESVSAADTGESSEEIAAAHQAETEKELSKLQENLDEMKLTLEEKQQQMEEVRQENGDLKLRVQTFEHAFKGDASQLGSSNTMCREELALVIEEMIEDMKPVSVLRLLSVLYKDSVRIIDGAFEAAVDNANIIPVSGLYHKVKSLATDGIDVLRNSGRMIDLNNVVPGNLSVQESITVRNNARLRKFREFKDGDTSRLMWPHLSIDYRNRLYFDYCPDEGRILIGYVGKHLPSAKNATT